MSPELFFLLGALCAGHAFLASFRGRAPFAMAWFLGGWLTGEFALFHLAWQAALTVYAVSSGALDAPIGQVGLALMGVSGVGLLLAHHRARQAEPIIEQALVDALGADYRDAIAPDRPAPSATTCPGACCCGRSATRCPRSRSSGTSATGRTGRSTRSTSTAAGTTPGRPRPWSTSTAAPGCTGARSGRPSP